MKTERQCAFRDRSSGLQCEAQACVGRRYCKVHGNGKKSLTQRPDSRRFKAMRYSRFLGKRLADHVQSITSPESEVTSLKDELAILRGLACDSLALYEAASSSDDPANVLRAGELVKDAMREVRDMVSALVRVEKDTKATLDAVTVNNLIHQTVRVFEGVLDQFSDAITVDPKLIANEVARRIEKEVVITNTDLEREEFIKVDDLRLPLEERRKLLAAVREAQHAEAQ